MAMLHPFDPKVNKPRPNPDGTVSTELTRTVQFPDGSWANVPSLWWGDGSDVKDLGQMSDDQIGEFASRYEQQAGAKFPRYSDLTQAETAAKERSAAGGGENGAITATGSSGMQKFTLSYNGDDYEVDAPDEATALDAFAESMGIGSEQAPPTPQQKYDTALQGIRAQIAPNDTDQQFAERVKTDPRLKPYGVGDLANHGMFFGLTDEIESGMSALPDLVGSWFGGKTDPGKSYDAWEALNTSRRDLGREQTGWAGTGAEVLGGLAGFGPGAAAAATAPSLLRTAATSGLTGAGMGAAYGFGSTDGNVGDRAGGALVGAGTGLVTGALVPVVTSAASAGFRNVADALARNRVAEANGISPGAADFIRGTLGADDALGVAGSANMARAGGEGMLADAGRSAQNALDYTIQSSGAAGRIARDAIEARTGRDSQAINDALDTAFGQPQGVDTTITGIRQGSSGARSANYDAAYAQPIDYSSQGGALVEELLQRVPPEAIREANRLMSINGERSSQILAEVADDGTVSFRTLPDVRQLDYITRALNSEAKNGIGAGAMGGQTDVGSALQSLSSDIRNVVGNLVPEYRSALNTAAGTIREVEAVRLGADLFRSTREEVAAGVANLTPQELQQAAQGIRSSLDEALANVTRTMTDGDVPAREAIAALRKLSSRANREKVALVIGEQRAASLFDELDRSAQTFELRAGVADNSKTFQRQEMGRRVKDTTDPDGLVASALKGEPLKLAQAAIQTASGRTPAASMARKDELLSEVARILTLPASRGVRVASALNNLNGQTARNQAVAQALMQAGRSIGPVSGYLAAQQAQGLRQ